jgi:methylglutaconyl-CoA hydratase
MEIRSVLDIRRSGSTAFVIMRRAEVRNALNPELIAALRSAFEQLGSDSGVRAIVLEGDGKAFSGGADIQWMRSALDLTESENLRDAEALAAMLRVIDECPKPVVARVHGFALGGGSGLAAVADIVVAADDAMFGFTEVKLGIIPAVISPFVVAKIGISHSRALFITGERFGAAHAQRIGLVHHVVPVADLDECIGAVLSEFKTSGMTAVAAVKKTVRDVVLAPDVETRTAVTTRAIAAQRTTPEGQEGLRAFLDRRPAAWHEL